MKMSRTKPPLRTSPHTPKTMAANVIVVRNRWRKMLRRASLNISAAVSNGVDDVHARSDPGRVDACHDRRTDRERCRLESHRHGHHDFGRVAERHAGWRRHRDTYRGYQTRECIAARQSEQSSENSQ